MSGPTKQTAQAGKKGGWGTMFSSAVAGLESRLDTILAEDSEASARSRAAEQALKEAGSVAPRSDISKLQVPSRTTSVKGSAATSRDTSRTRVNDRLAERLAKATAKKAGSDAGSTYGSEVPSRSATPAVEDSSPRASNEERRSTDVPRSAPVDDAPEVKVEHASVEDGAKSLETIEQKPESATAASLQNSGLPINPARHSMDSEQTRSSVDQTSQEASARPSVDLPNGHQISIQRELEAESLQMRNDQEAAEKQRQEEMHAYMERIDALQAKLQYLAKETVAAAKEANASASAGSADAKLAEKDERIALLMEEGEKLSKTELRHMQTIKKLRAKQAEDEKATADLQKRFARVEVSEKDLKTKIVRADRIERQAKEQAKQIENIIKQVDELQTDRESASELIRNLTQQLQESEIKAKEAREEVDSAKTAELQGRIASLENEVEDANIEKKLAEDRAASQIKKAEEDNKRQAERFSVSELELKNEVSGLESKLEAMRLRAEEAGMDGGGESNVKLLRQIETLQSQYALAKGNWETIEGSLNARLATLEKERDETARREAEVRKKARDAGTKARRAEEELEAKTDESSALTQDVKIQREQIDSLQSKLEQTATAFADAKADLDRQRRVWESELAGRIEEEKAKWQRSAASTLRNDSPSTYSRKASAADVFQQATMRGKHRVASYDLNDRPLSRRSSTQPTPLAAISRYATATPPEREPSPAISRQESTTSMMLENPNSSPPTPNIEVEGLNDDNDFDRRSNSPQRTINDLVSTSTAGAGGAGPSVQLVERMSAAVRRLEAEKASHKDELARLQGQRDSARDEVVVLMREVESSKAEQRKAGEAEDLRRRYEASLEILGEREEEVEELKGDVRELKRIYRELVEEKVGGR